MSAPRRAQLRGRARRGDANVFDAVVAMSRRCRRRQAVVIALWSEGARERMSHVLPTTGCTICPTSRGRRRWRCRRPRSALAVLGLETGFETADAAVSASRTSWATGWCGRAAREEARRRLHRRGDEPVAGDLVVHVDHGIGRFVGLRRSRPPARRTTASKSTMPAATSSICRSRTSSCCRATARRTPRSSSTGSAARLADAQGALKKRIREMADS
jgi:transcription-repair coupling factor (superfamily II helicase)